MDEEGGAPTPVIVEVACAKGDKVANDGADAAGGTEERDEPTTNRRWCNFRMLQQRNEVSHLHNIFPSTYIKRYRIGEKPLSKAYEQTTNKHHGKVGANRFKQAAQRKHPGAEQNGIFPANHIWERKK